MLTALVVLGFLVVFGTFALAVAGGVLGFRLLTRKLDLDERALAIQEQRAKSSGVVAIPPDLMRRITSWGSEEAQASERKVILDLYHDMGEDWDCVRQTLPKLADDVPVELVA